MTLIFYKLLAALLIFAVGIISALYPLRKKHTPRQTEPAQLGEALASGIFLGAAFFHMLPDAIQSFNSLYPHLTYPLPELVCVAGFLLLLFLERLSIIDPSQRTKSWIPYILSLTLIIHALTEGAALGIGNTWPETTLLFVAILAHKGSESFALCVMLLRHALPFRRLLLIVTFFALMTPLGILLGAAIKQNTGLNGELTSIIFNAFAAGTFLYISTLHHVHFHKHADEAQGLLEFVCLVMGTVMMGAIALWA